MAEDTHGVDDAGQVKQPAPKRTDFRSFDQEDIDNWFKYHAPSVDQLSIYGELRAAAKIFAETINRHVPAGPDKTAAIRKVREAVMTANAAVAYAPGIATTRHC